MPREAVGFDTPNFIEDRDEQNQSNSDDENGDDAEIEEEGSEVQESAPHTPQSTISNQSSANNNSRSSATKKPRGTKRKDNNASQSLMTMVHEKLKSTRAEDEFDIIGKNVAEKLRRLPQQMKVFAEKISNDGLFEAQLGNLNRYAFISIPEPQRRVQPHHPPSFEQVNTDVHVQGREQLQPVATSSYQSVAVPQSSQNSEMQSNSLRWYYNNFGGSPDNVQ